MNYKKICWEGEKRILFWSSFIIIFILFFFLTRNTETFFIQKLSRKEAPFKIFYPMAAWILLHLPKGKRQVGKEQERVLRFRSLYPDQDAGIKYHCFLLNKISVLLCSVLVFGIFAFLYEIGFKEEMFLKEGYFLVKPEQKAINSYLSYKSSEGIQGEVLIKLQPSEKTKEELENFLFSIRSQIETLLLGDNTIDRVTKKLNFPEKVAGYSVEWKIDTNLIRLDGTLKQEQIDPEGTVTILSAILQYYGQEIDFQIPVRLFPKEQSKEEKLQEEIEAILKFTQENTSKESLLSLPKEIEGKKLIWKEKKNSKIGSFFLLFFMTTVCLIKGMEYEIKQKENKRKRQMEIDYPNIIRQMTLLLGSGMTIRGAWEYIIKDYEVKRKQEFHFAYEEMRIALHELELGVSEEIAYEKFGKRCKMLLYLKFSTILVQNLKKGSRSILPLLQQEAITSSNEQRELAKRLGEEAGTKLLAPMMILLILVLFLVLVPAFTSFY